MSRRLRAAAAISLLACGAAIAGESFAADGGRTALGRTTISALPVAPAAAPEAPPDLPKRIPAATSTAGLHVARPDPSFVEVTATHAPDAPAECIRLHANGFPQQRLTLAPAHEVVPLVVERLVEDGHGGASLSLETFHFDARTRGAVLAKTQTFPLKAVVAPGKGDEAVYAYRDDAAVHVIWRASEALRWRDMQFPGSIKHCALTHLVLSASPNEAKSSALAVGSLMPSVKSSRTTSGSVRLSASISKTTRDPEPVLSVSVAFDAGERSTTLPSKRSAFPG